MYLKLEKNKPKDTIFVKNISIDIVFVKTVS